MSGRTVKHAEGYSFNGYGVCSSFHEISQSVVVSRTTTDITVTTSVLYLIAIVDAVSCGIAGWSPRQQNGSGTLLGCCDLSRW